jgi:putative addiction module CopG family antidote
MNISLPTEFEDYIAARIESGEFSSATEVVLDALRGQQRLRLEREIESGLAEGRKQVAAGAFTEATADFFEQARDRIRRRAR